MRITMSPAPEPVITTSLADEIALRLQTAILAGEHPPGAHLFQDELCERFGVSRTPVREALRKLQAKHLVVLLPNRGATVSIPSRQQLIDDYNVRAELEGYACELACATGGALLLEALDRAHHQVAVAAEQADGGRSLDGDLALDVQVADANSDFHGAIARASGNERLHALIVELQGCFPRDYVWRALTSADEMRALNLDDHARIRRALAKADATLARRQMRSHILRARTILIDYLDSLKFWR
jgi:DNA-binding GntR family transcriptional regulator